MSELLGMGGGGTQLFIKAVAKNLILCRKHYFSGFHMFHMAFTFSIRKRLSNIC